MIQKDGITADVLTIKEFFKESKFDIPPYQRSYSWTEQELNKLFEDLLEASTDNSDNLYLLGAITTISEDRKTYDVLDGQQRITTISLIIDCIRKTISDSNYAIKTDCENIVLIDDNTTRVSQSRNADKLSFRYVILEEGTKKSNKIIDIYSKIKNNNLLQDIDFVKFLLNKVAFVLVNTKNVESAYQIFETLNDRSRDLEKLDLVRNKLFRAMSKSDIDNACNTWDDLYAKAESIRNGKSVDTHLQDLFTTFFEANLGVWIETKDLFHKIKIDLELHKDDTKYPYHLFNRVANCFDIYSTIYNPNGSTGLLLGQIFDDDSLIEDLDIIKKYAPKIRKAILFSIIYLIREADLKLTNETKIEIKNIIHNLINFIKRTKFTGNIPAAKYGKELSRIAKEILDYKDINLLKNKWFVAELQKIDNNNKRILVDDNFIKAMENSDQKIEIAKDILIMIENSSRDTAGDTLRRSSDLHAEHICPQELKYDEWKEEFSEEVHQYYLDKLGNYTLLAEKNNKEASCKPFVDKKPIYKESVFKINRALVAREKWNKQAIEERTRSLAEEIAVITRIIDI